jgi:hypothetical protein
MHTETEAIRIIRELCEVLKEDCSDADKQAVLARALAYLDRQQRCLEKLEGAGYSVCAYWGQIG